MTDPTDDEAQIYSARDTMRLVRECRELVILNTPIRDLPKVDIGSLSLGQAVVLADALRAVRALGEEASVTFADSPVDTADAHRGDEQPPESWLKENCTCAEHVAARGGTPNAGLYL